MGKRDTKSFSDWDNNRPEVVTPVAYPGYLQPNGDDLNRAGSTRSAVVPRLADDNYYSLCYYLAQIKTISKTAMHI
jgi:hypothetical protein